MGTTCSRGVAGITAGPEGRWRRAAATSAGTRGVVICSLPSSEALRQTAAELAESARPPRIVIETSTLPIAVKEQARRTLARAGTILLDCPLSGTGAQARAKDLVVYASGDRRAYRRVVPILDAFARAHYYVGAFGAGSKMKFVANLLVAIHNVAAAEALVLAMKAGLDPAMVVKVIGDGAGKLADVPGARPDDGEGRLLQGPDEARDLAEGHDDHRRFRAGGGLPDAAVRGDALRSTLAANAIGRPHDDTAAVCQVLERMAGGVREVQSGKVESKRQKARVAKASLREV